MAFNGLLTTLNAIVKGKEFFCYCWYSAYTGHRNIRIFTEKIFKWVKNVMLKREPRKTSTAGKWSNLFSEVTMTVSNYTGLHEFAVLKQPPGQSWFLIFNC